MDGKRRTIEIDEAVAVTLEERAAARGMSVETLIADYATVEPSIVLEPTDLADLQARIDEWDRDRIGYDGEEIFDWLRDRAARLDPPLPRPRRF